MLILNGFITKAIFILPFGFEFGINLEFILACGFTFTLMKVLQYLDLKILGKDSVFEMIRNGFYDLK